MKRWTQLDHTADLAIQGEGDTKEEALLALVEGLAAQVYDPGAVMPLEDKSLASEGVDLEDAVVTFLGEFLYMLYYKKWLPAYFAEANIAESSVKVTFRGEPFDPSRHEFLSEVKAATYHDYDFAKVEDGLWRVRAVFDR